MARVTVQDLSGTSTPVTSNPYDGLIQATDSNAKKLQERYQVHRITRNGQQRDKILANDFSGWILDEHLTKLDGPQKEDTYRDPRYCLVFWARPPQKIKNLINIIQQKLKDAAPDLWLMPLDNLHMTAMEVTHSKSEAEIEHLVSILESSCKAIADHPGRHGPRLIKPMVSYDSAALALSFVPAVGEVVPADRAAKEDEYTYHHFRRDLHSQITKAGVEVGSRYVVPSAHLTIARFNTPNAFGGDPLNSSVSLDLKKRKHWVQEIEMINNWLEAEFWPHGHDKIMPGGEWVVGQEKGLDFRKGTLWYGGGETIYLGQGYNRCKTA